MKKRCTSCERVVRILRRAVVLEPDGELRAGLICPRCVQRAILLVAPPATTVAPPCGSCHKFPADVCYICVERMAKQIAELTAANVALDALRRAAAEEGSK